jgi:hypothetical protein
MSFMLAMHIITHLLTGCFIASFVFMRRELSFKRKIIILALSAFFGIFPDLLGPRDISPWSHSFFVMGLIMLPIVYLLRFPLKKFSFFELYLCFGGSVLIGHIFIDYLGHGVHLIYPLSKQAYTMPLIYLGDPTGWVPMLFGVFLFLLPTTRKSLLNISLAAFIVIYLGLKLSLLVQIGQSIPSKFTLTHEAIVKIYPLGDYQVKKLSDFWKMEFYVTDSQRTIRGVVPLLGGETLLNVNNIYLLKGDIIISNTDKDGLEVVSRAPASKNDTQFEVIDEKDGGSDKIIIARDREGNNRQFIFRDGKWSIIP